MNAVVNRAGQSPPLQLAGKLAGSRLLCADGEIGGIEALLFDGTSWVERVIWTDRGVAVDLVRDAIKAAPVLDPSGVISRDDEARLFKHYGRPVYWDAGAGPDHGSAGLH